ncbi:phosphoenolpyruvate--protein phosphotransferase [Haliovirga abyssi]|uniref:Phosphoenolpyruvate-protein phosphotransferase n=1 Tax=Haliovirga abyssi TaxID=2996794 RepID=A0AAU9DE02_9FUSO|nr:phosphoenolpyruvate--protein phosphotransferase [Haliovirga abyssi]BDU51580.1 phosphoenolpyruvate-protein phosphotransferase [Haliovirga abyssi]
METKIVEGIGASPGIAIGEVFINDNLEPIINLSKIEEDDIEREIENLKKAQLETKKQLLEIKEKTKINFGEEKAEIFEGHITLLEDEEFFDEVVEKITDDRITASNSLEQTMKEYIEIIGNLDDEYLRERVADLYDISKRWLLNINGGESLETKIEDENIIIVSKDLTPSDTAQLDLSKVNGFITEIGGQTSHSSIMARSLGLPAVVGVTGIIEEIKTGDLVILDAINGKIFINPNDERLEEYKEKEKIFLEEKEKILQLKDKSATTKDGYKVDLWANIGNPSDVKAAGENGAEGVGLYRTEFLFMNSKELPTEEEQFKAYKIVAEEMKGKPVTIRTMDIGGDKELPYLELPKEMNPFLGWRAIRISLEKRDVFKTQLRAILRASAFGNIKIMYPMIISIGEVRKANTILEECKNELVAENIEFDKNIKTGIMVETPAVVLKAYEIAKEVDFFSIGTNDLTQYLLAVDRGNEKISYLYSTFNPAVLKAISIIINDAHRAGITVSMCGEFAGDERASAILIGLGLDAFSMSAGSILKVKRNIMSLKKESCEKIANEVLLLDTDDEVVEYVEKNLKLI